MGDFSPLPGSRPGPSVVMQIFVQGNTTGSTSSMLAIGASISFSGSNLNSVGFSSNAVIFSSQVSQGATAVGNTTLTSSASLPIATPTISGDGIGIGFNAGTMVLSAPVAVNATVSYHQPAHIASGNLSQSITAASQGVMIVQPVALRYAISFNQVNFLGSWGYTGSSLSSSTTGTTTAQVKMTITAAFYTPQAGTASKSYSLFLSTTATMGIGESLSATSRSYSKTNTLSFNIGAATSTSTASVSSTATTTSGPIGNPALLSNALISGFHRGDIPWATSLPPGSYLLGLMQSTATSGLALSLSVTPVGAIFSNSNQISPLNRVGTNVWGVGSTSVAGSTAPATIDPASLSTISNHLRPWFMIRNGGT